MESRFCRATRAVLLTTLGHAHAAGDRRTSRRAAGSRRPGSPKAVPFNLRDQLPDVVQIGAERAAFHGLDRIALRLLGGTLLDLVQTGAERVVHEILEGLCLSQPVE